MVIFIYISVLAVVVFLISRGFKSKLKNASKSSKVFMSLITFFIALGFTSIPIEGSFSGEMLIANMLIWVVWNLFLWK